MSDSTREQYESMRRLEVGVVTNILAEHPDMQLLEVLVKAEKENAINYVSLTGRASVGDEVLLNVIAVRLGLGTGGYHFVVANLTSPTAVSPSRGHIMKMRYSPHQINVLSADAQESEYHQVLKDTDTINGMPVLVGELHSMLAPASAGFKAIAGEGSRVVYIMTDSAALPIAFSELVRELKLKGFVDATITIGQAFGGDAECVNIFTALLTARHILGASVAIVTPGPGHVGTATKFGFSGVEVAWMLEAVKALHGKPILMPRVSFSEKRSRHFGISHHTITVLTRIMNVSTTVCFHNYSGDERKYVEEQIRINRIAEHHEIVWEDGTLGIELALSHDLTLKSMGRRFEDDPQYFLTASAGGVYAAKLLNEVKATSA
ncbi:MAG: hypothetical protein HZRFUVUK_000900 [Candidatus Fervidibacterota bacterium]|jgi:hypothetical protein